MQQRNTSSIRRKQLTVLTTAAAAAAAALAGRTPAASAAGLTWNGGGVDNNWSTVFNWSPAQAPASGDSLTFDGFGRLSNTNDLSGLTLSGVTFASTAGGFSLGGNQVTLGGDIIDNVPVLSEIISLPMALNANRNANVAGGGFLTLSGVISGGFAFNKTGLGILTLTGANTFSGGTTINQGTLAISSDGNLGAVPGAATANSLVVNGGTLLTTANVTINSNRGISVGPSSGTGSSIFDVQSGTTLTYGGVMANNGTSTSGIIKRSFGTLSLSGANTYTGPTAIMNGGLTLNFAGTTAPTTNIINPLSTLSMGGATAGLGQNNNATLTMTGKANTANTQTFASTNIDIYGSLINVTKGTGTASATLNLGVLTHTLGGTLVVPTLPTSSQGVVNASGTTLNKGIIGGWAIAGTATVNRGITMGSDFATLDINGNIVAYNGYVTAPAYDGTAANTYAGNAAINANTDKNLKFVGTATATEMRVDAENANTTTDINTLNFQTGGGNHVLTIGTGNTLRLGRYGAIFKSTTGNNQLFIGGTGGTTFTAGPNANAGNLTAGGAPNTPGELVIALNELQNNSGCITAVSNIVDNGTGAVTVIKTGVASAKIDGHNTFSGGLYVNQGRLQLAGSEQLRDSVNTALTVGNPDGLGTGPVFVAPGAYVYLSGVNGTAVFTGPGAIAGAIAGSAQNAPVLNNFTISGIGTNQEGIGAIRFGNRSILSGQVTLGGDARLSNGNAPAYPAINQDATTLYYDPGNLISGRITGGFALDFGSANSVSTNLMISNTNNDWSGNTTFISGGGATTLRLGASEVIPDGVGKGNLAWGAGANNATLDLNGYSETVNGLSTAGSSNLAGDFIQNNGFTPTITGPVGSQTYNYTAGTSTLTVGNFNATANFGGTIRDNDASATVTLPDPNTPGGTIVVTAPWTTAGSKIALTKIGTGIQTLSGANSYTGDTNINAGTLAVTGSLASSGNVNVNNSSSALAGTGTVGNIVVTSGGHVRPGAAGTGSIGTLNAATINMTGGDLGIDFGAGTSDQLNLTTSATFSGSNTITPSGTPTAGTYVVVNSASAITGAGTLTLAAFPNLPDTRPASGTLNLSNPNQVQVVVTGGAKALTWTGATNGTWDKGTTGTVNWQNNTPAPDKFFNADTITFGDGPTNRTITVNTTVQPGAINFNNSTGNDYTISGTGSIIGLTGITKDGGGSVTIGTNNSYSGPTTVNSGTLVLAGTNTTTSTINGGTLALAGAVTGDVTNNGTLEVDNGGSLVGTITNNNVVRFNRTDTSTFAGVITGGGTVNKDGSGTVVLSATNSNAGPFNINAGTLGLTSFAGFGANTAPVTVNAGGQIDLSAIATANAANGFGPRSISIIGDGPDGNGAIVNNGLNQQNALQQVSLSGNASFGGSGRFDLRGGGPNLNLNGFTLTKNGTAQFSIVAGTIGGGNIVVNGGTLSIETTTNADGTGMITYNAGTTGQFFNLTGTFQRPLTFNGGTAYNGNQAGTSTLQGNITLAQDTTFNVTNTGTGPQMVLTATVGSTGVHGINKTGNGVLVISGNATYTGNTTVSGGVLRYTTNNFTTGANMTAAAGGTIELPSDGSFNRVIKAASVASTGGRINIDDNKMILTAQGVGTWNGTAYDGVTGVVAAGYSPNQDFSGNGIVTTQSNATGGNTLTNIGVASNTDLGLSTFGGVSVGANDTLVMYTYGGDANLDGAITGDDYFQIDSGFPAGAHGWFNGDFNYDGSITGDDYFVIDSNFSAQGAAIPTSGGIGAGLAGVQAVPEPASIGLIGVAATTSLARRRRRAK